MVLLQNQMIQNKNLKLKLGLCGLALTSFLVLNSRANTVHADTVSGNNANAITWDADNDDSQVVKEESQQDNSSQSVQTQGAVQEQKALITQSEQTQNTPKADADQHDQQHVQSVRPNRAETSTVRSSSVQRQAVVQNNADYNETLSSLGSNTNLGDLGVYDVSPDSVKSNIQSQVQSQLAINDASLANFNMNKDASGNLTASFGVYSNTAKQQNWWTNVKVNNTVVPGIQWRTNADMASDGNLHEASTGKPIVYSVGIHKLPGAVIHNPAGNKVNVHFVDLNGKAVGGDYSIDTTKNGDGQYKLANGYQTLNGNTNYNVTYATHNVHHDATGHYEDYSYQDGYTDTKTGNTLYGSNGEYSSSSGNEYLTTGSGVYYSDAGTIVATNPDGTVTADNSSNGHTDITTYTPHYATGSTWVEDTSAYDETVVDKDSFTDKSGNVKSGNVKSVTGNVVNIVVTKPQNVDPNSANCKRQAQRVIHVTFPNGVKPKSYDSIADSAGTKLMLDSNNNLTQTVTFTRSETIDSLTGKTLTQTPWQQHGAINAVTLPAIPGYTMVTTN